MLVKEKRRRISPSPHMANYIKQIIFVYPKPIMFAVVFALYTGCRKGEVIGLQWRDVDFEENVIHISHQLSRHYDIEETGDTKTILEVTDTKTKFSVRDIYMFKSFTDEFKTYKERMIEWKKQNRFHTQKKILCLLVQRIKQLNQECFISITKRSCRTPESKIVISTHSVNLCYKMYRKRRRHLDGISYTRSLQHFNDAQQIFTPIAQAPKSVHEKTGICLSSRRCLKQKPLQPVTR